jgi:hypothetical protein
MPAVTFACPECGKVLQSSKPIPAGKKIKCPTCAAVFPMPEKEDEELAASVSTKPRRPAAAAPALDDEDERPRRKAGRSTDDEDDESPRSRRQSRDDDEEDEDERPRRSRDDDDDDEEDKPRRKKKKKAAKGGSGRGMGLLIGAVAVVLVLFLAGGGIGAYFIWFSGVNRGSGNEDPLAFVPKDADIIVGMDFEALMNDSAIGPELEKSMRQQVKGSEFLDNCKKETGLEVKELMAHTVIAGDINTLNNAGMGGGMGPGMGPGGMGPGMGGPGMGGPGGPPGMGGPGAPQRPKGLTMILRPSRPFDQKKIVRSCKNPVHKTAHGKSYYDVVDGDIRTVYMPSNRTLILSTLQGTELDALFASDGTTPSVSADTVTMVRSVEKTTYWVVVPFEGETKKKLDGELKNLDHLGNDAKGLGDHVSKAKGAAIWLSMEGNQANFGLALACADANSANQLVQSIDAPWQQVKGLLGDPAQALADQGTPKLGKVFSDVFNSLKFHAEGTMAKATASTSRAALGEAVVEAKAKQGGGGFGGGWGGGNPGGGNPGGGMPGGGNPGGGRGGRGKK